MNMIQIRCMHFCGQPVPNKHYQRAQWGCNKNQIEAIKSMDSVQNLILGVQNWVNHMTIVTDPSFCLIPITQC